MRYFLLTAVVLCLFIGSVLGQSGVKVIAHRGFSSIAPENTMTAFEKAIEIGADYLELDVHRTKDDSLVVIHDKSIARVSCDSLTSNISEMTYKELQGVSAGYCSKFHDKYRDERIPTLLEVLELAKNKIKVCIELKVEGAEEKVLQLVDQLDMEDQVIIFAFDYRTLAKIRHLNKSIKILYLISYVNQYSIDYAKVINVDAIGAGYGTEITKELVDQIHENNMELWKWTVDKEEDMKQLISLGVDGIITNRPDVALEIRKLSL